MNPGISASDRNKWRAWLEENHASEKEVWLIYFKKHTGRGSVTYMESVKEALCFGWIDGIKKSVDEERYTHRFTPRRSGSKWSALNIKLAREMIETGQMTKAGLEAFNNRVEYAGEISKPGKKKDINLAPELEKILKTSQKAWDNFNQLAPGYRRQYVGWLQSAKKPETRERRLKELIGVLEKTKSWV